MGLLLLPRSTYIQQSKGTSGVMYDIEDFAKTHLRKLRVVYNSIARVTIFITRTTP